MTTTAPVDRSNLRATTPGRWRRASVVGIGRAGLVALLVGALHVLAATDVGGPGTIPTPLEILRSVASGLGDAQLRAAVVDTMTGWAIGLSISVVVGVLLGGLLGSSDLAYRSVRGLFDFCRAVPPVALIPIGLLILGVGDLLKVALVIEVCVWPVLLQTMAGVHAVEVGAKEAGRTMRMSRWQSIRLITLPSSLPYIGTGVRLAAVMALLVCIGVELLAGAEGLGLELYLRQTSGDNAGVWACVVIAAVIGIVVTRTFSAGELRLTRWQPANRSSA